MWEIRKILIIIGHVYRLGGRVQLHVCRSGDTGWGKAFKVAREV